MSIESECPLRITVGPGPLLVGRSREADMRLPHPTVSGRHARLRLGGSGIEIEDLDSRFGTFVNGSRIRKATVQPGDRIKFGAIVVYRTDGSGLVRDDVPDGMSLAGDGITIARGDRILVEDVSFEIRSDSFVGLLAPSGVGKSTLLNCLAGFLEPQAGRIQFDGHSEQRTHLEEFRSQIGYLQQQDVLLSQLTARENLLFAAWLRLGSAEDHCLHHCMCEVFPRRRRAGNADSDNRIESEVRRVLNEVGLADHADKQTKNLSGGQRKRLSVAIELLRRPRLLLLDEPSSGLDPGAEAGLMELLRQLAHRGTTVVCATHLMENIRLMDEVIVLGQREACGRLAYAGPPQELLPHFGCQGFADLYERLSRAEAPASRVTSPENREALLRRASIRAAKSGEGHHSHPATQRRLNQLVTAGSGLGPLAQSGLLVSREFLRLGRDLQQLVAVVLQPLVLGFLNCFAQYAAVESVPLLFFSIVIAIWLGLNNSARDLVRDRKLYLRERLAGLSRDLPLLSKLLFHFLVGAIQLALLLGVVWLFLSVAPLTLSDQMKHVSPGWTYFILLLVYTGALGIGLLVSTLAKSEEMAVAWLPLLVMPQLLISAVGTDSVQRVFHQQTESDLPTPFRPVSTLWTKTPSRSEGLDGLKPTFRHWMERNMAMLVDCVSLACLSRPAILLARPPNDVSAVAWLADLGHLLLLSLIIWLATFTAFHRVEERWMRLSDG